MSIPIIAVPDIETDRDFEAFCKIVRGHSPLGNTVMFEEGRVAGRLIRFTAPDELNIRVWDFTLSTAAHLVSRPAKAAEHTAASLIFVLQPRACQLTRIGNHFQFYKADYPFQLTVRRSTRLWFQADAHQAIRLIEMHIGARFLEESNDIFANQGAGLLPDNHSFIELRLCTPRTLWRLETLTDIMRVEHPPLLQIKSLCIDCITELFSSMPSVSGESRTLSAYEDEMRTLEELINSRLCGTLPPLATLARQTGMSLSTLKRHFKARHGMNIYEYYLSRKMSFAKKLLEEQQLSVNAIAEMLHYESVSNFIETFKKHHGFSPGRMKKR